MKAHEKKDKETQKVEVLNFVPHKHDIKKWLMDFAWAVRERDFDKGRSLFCDSVIGFGTRARCVRSLEELVEEQWSKTWTKTSEFQFNLDELSFFHDEHMAHIAVTWSSLGHRFGTKFKRHGRASLLLVGKNGSLKCAASHFSLDP